MNCDDDTIVKLSIYGYRRPGDASRSTRARAREMLIFSDA
jgi:hypothetical protein